MNYLASPTHEVQEVDAVSFVELQGVEVFALNELLVYLYADHLRLEHIVQLDEF